MDGGICDVGWPAETVLTEVESEADFWRWLDEDKSGTWPNITLKVEPRRMRTRAAATKANSLAAFARPLAKVRNRQRQMITKP